jgi:hypothetical protein
MHATNSQTALLGIIKLLKSCDHDTLITVRKKVQTLIDRAEPVVDCPFGVDLQDKRAFSRYSTDFCGKAVRLTNVRPGEKKEFSAKIKDISEKGMNISVSTDFIPSNVIEVVFAGPKSVVKRSFLQIVRIRKQYDQHDEWMELGCMTISKKQVREQQIQEKKSVEMRRRLREKMSIRILVSGPDHQWLTTRIKIEGYQVEHCESIKDTINAVTTNRKFNLVLFTQGTAISHNDEILNFTQKNIHNVAKLGICDFKEHFSKLYQNGFDECITHSANRDFLFYTIEQAILGYQARTQTNTVFAKKEALILSSNTISSNMLSYQLDEYGFNCYIANNLRECATLNINKLGIIFVEICSNEQFELKEVLKTFKEIPVIGICNSLSDSQQAMSAGCERYVTMPPNEDDFKMVIENCLK